LGSVSSLVSEIQNGGYGRTWFNIGPYGKNVSKCFFSETTWTIETKLPRNNHWKVLYKVSVFYADRKSKMGHVEYPTGTKNRNFVEDHPRNIPAKFGSNWPSGFGEEA
jgi:hypothetical protein